MTTISRMLALAETGSQRPGGDRTALTLDGRRVGATESVSAGAVLVCGDSRYRIVEGLDGFLYPALMHDTAPKRPVRVHCGLHKCLTMYQRRVYKSVGKLHRKGPSAWFGRPAGYAHFYHEIRDFQTGLGQFSLASVSGQRLDLDSYDDIRVVRFLRDPRDLLVSAYYYHKRGAEGWCTVTDPVLGDFDQVHGGIPEGVGPGESMQTFLERVPIREAMDAEIAFRRPHFDSMMAWDPTDPRVLTLRYEDILGHEVETFERIGRHFEWGPLARRAARRAAARYALGGEKTARKGHVRNPRPQQWRDHLGPDQLDQIEAEWGALLDAYGYPTGAAARKQLASA